MAESTLPAESSLPTWLGVDALARVWAILGDGLERRGLVATGRLEVRDLTREERHGLTDLLGVAVTSPRVRIDLARLDSRITQRTGSDLVTTTSLALRRGLADRPALRHERAETRQAPFLAVRAWLSETWPDQEVAVPEWLHAWLEGLRRDGVLARVREADRVVVRALEVLAARDAFAAADDDVPADRRGTVARTELAAQVTGSSHGLDDGEPLSVVVLRALAARAGAALAQSAHDRRLLWESVGVVLDSVSSTCLVWGLAPQGGSPAARRLTASLEGGAPVHATWWDLNDGLRLATGQAVLVCENPRTLEAVAERGRDGPGVVCTMGRPNLVVRSVLGLLCDAGARLRYHGDFDWPGIGMANACAREYGALPWLMTAADYLAGHGTQPLVGGSVEADWDPELGAAMRGRGVCVHEEAVLGVVLRQLDDLAG
ncbi:MAG TPA: TIGR02679 family protein [Intrasporangium sp.]|uniref:TIGR02679 family protein n=1 Tax=Intrasporangium sp. TaxID=1925024 RepID=UPI002D793682|nr:TIGR02679 family protein [Intrasporangium sp.]HET7398966.1 TIGR02679 family protein [Intrasporangium sp.]